MTLTLARLKVHNIRSFVDAEILLSEGTTLIGGDVGAGKTSLLHAIELALFGFAEVDATYLIRHKATTAEVALTLSDGARRYVFSRRFRRRNRKGRDSFEPEEKGTGLSTDGASVRYPPTELRQRAIDLLGFPDNPNPRAHSDLWRWAVYVPQERMRQILEDSDAEARLETVRKALGLERYRRAAENAQGVARQFREEAAQYGREAELLAHWESDALRIRAAIDESERSVESARQAETSARERLKLIEREISEREAGRRRLEGDRREAAELAQRIQDLKKSRSARESRLAQEKGRRSGLDGQRRALSGAPEELERAREELAAALGRESESRHALEAIEVERRKAAIAEAETRSAAERASEGERALERARREQMGTIERLEALLKETPTRPPIPPGETDRPSIERSLAEAETEAERATGELHHQEVLAQELTELREGGRCPRCGQSVTAEAFGRHREESGRGLEAARAARRRAAEQLHDRKEARAILERYEQELVRFRELEGRRSEARAEQARREEAVREAERLADRARHDVQEGEARLRSSAPALDQASAASARQQTEEASVLRARDRVGAAELALEGLRGLDGTIAEVDRQLAREASDLLEGDRELSRLGDRSTLLERSLAGMSTLLEEIGRMEARRATTGRLLEEALERLHRSEGELGGARERLAEAESRAHERQTLVDRSERFTSLAEFLSGAFRTSLLELERRLLGQAKVEFDRSFGRLFAALIEDPGIVARTDPRFSPSVEIEGEWTPPEALSGGERTALALAYRLALGQVVRSLERLRLATLLLDEPTDGFSPEQVQRMGEVLRELGVPQVILVSHESALEGVADRVLRVRKAEGISSVSTAGSEPAERVPAPRPA
ncbi:MAG TPA: SMC family ATPase [Thermoplasmata archaeon]|nr:SMC family ATPase [Thermoplasmata archaeon]